MLCIKTNGNETNAKAADNPTAKANNAAVNRNPKTANNIFMTINQANPSMKLKFLKTKIAFLT